jgi:hypothetical protein
MRGDIPPLPQYALIAWCLVKLRDNFTFYLSSSGYAWSFSFHHGLPILLIAKSIMIVSVSDAALLNN